MGLGREEERSVGSSFSLLKDIRDCKVFRILSLISGPAARSFPAPLRIHKHTEGEGERLRILQQRKMMTKMHSSGEREEFYYISCFDELCSRLHSRALGANGSSGGIH
jgi:hypothetical protein